MKKDIIENINRLKQLMGLINEDTEDPKIIEKSAGSKEKPTGTYAKIPVSWKNGKNSYELQSDENYTFDGEYKYYLLPTIFYSSPRNASDPNLNYDSFNYGGILEGTYSLIKANEGSEIFEGKTFKVVKNSHGINYPENSTWDKLINDARSWSVDTYFEGKDAFIKLIYEDTFNFLTPTTKRLVYTESEPAGWSFVENGQFKDVSRFKSVPEIKNGAEYILDLSNDSKINFFVRTPRLIRLIPIWDGIQLTFKKSEGSEKSGEIIVDNSSNIA